MKRLLSLFFLLAVASSTTQLYRNTLDLLPPDFEGSNAVPVEAQKFLEKLASLGDKEEIHVCKRTALRTLGFISKKPKNKRLAISEAHWPILNYPTVTEAAAQAFTELSAKEAVNLAQSIPSFFYFAPPALLEAIPDYSSFSGEEITKGSEWNAFGSLLDIKSAVQTLPLPALLEALEQVTFEPTEHQRELLQERMPELLATNDPRVIYQLNFDDAKDCKLLSVDALIAFKATLSLQSFKRVAFAYVVYSNCVLEALFSMFVYRYPFFARNQAMFPEFRDSILSNFKTLIEERTKLIEAFQEDERDDNLAILLLTPFSGKLRASLQNAKIEPPFKLFEKLVKSIQVREWLWDASEGTTLFRSFSAKDLIKAFASVFPYGKFSTGRVARKFAETLLIGEPEEDVEEILELLNAYRIGQEACAVSLMKQKAINVIYTLNLADENRNLRTYTSFVFERRALEQIVQFQVDSEQLIAQMTPQLLQVFVRFPDLLGIGHLRVLAAKGLMSQAMKRNLSGNMISQLKDLVKFDNLDGFVRGLYVFSTDELLPIIKESVVLDPITFFDCIHERFWTDLETANPVDAMLVYNTMLPWMYSFANQNLIEKNKFADAVEAAYNAGIPFESIAREIVRWAIGVEMNYLQHLQFHDSSAFERFNAYELATRDSLSRLIDGANVVEQEYLDILRKLQSLIKQGSDSQWNRASPFETVKQTNEGWLELAQLLFDSHELFSLQIQAKLTLLESTFWVESSPKIESEPFNRALAGAVCDAEINLISGIQKRLDLNFDGEFVARNIHEITIIASTKGESDAEEQSEKNFKVPLIETSVKETPIVKEKRKIVKIKKREAQIFA